MNIFLFFVFIMTLIISAIMFYFTVDALKDWNLFNITSKLLSIGTLFTVYVSLTTSIVGIAYEIMKVR